MGMPQLVFSKHPFTLVIVSHNFYDESSFSVGLMWIGTHFELPHSMGRCGKFTYYIDKGTSKTHPNLQANLCYYQNDLHIYWNREPKEKTAAKYNFAKYANHAERQND